MSVPLLQQLERPVPHCQLGSFPTPVETADTLGEAVGIEELYVKRDGQSSETYGGNKVRKLEFLLADAMDCGRRHVWTGGGIGSNHVLATCLYARDCSLVPHAVQFPQPVTEHVRTNLAALSTTDPDLHLVGSELRAGLWAVALRLRGLLPSSDVYYLPPGGAAPIGELGYVNAVLELRRQIDEGIVPPPESIVVPVGTGGTIAGIVVGCELAELDATVIGVRVADKLFGNSIRIARLANQTARLLRAHGIDLPRFDRTDVHIVDGYRGDGYGAKLPSAETLRERDDEFVVPLDSTYTAKGLVGLREERDRYSLVSKRVLFWHTYNEADISDLVAAANPHADLPDPYQQFLTDDR